jgi:hypothetical protein
MKETFFFWLFAPHRLLDTVRKNNRWWQICGPILGQYSTVLEVETWMNMSAHFKTAFASLLTPN